MKEKQVLSSVIQSREAYDAIADHVQHNDLSEQGWLIWESVAGYYEMDSASKSCDVEILAAAVARKVSADKHKAMFSDLVASIAESTCSPSNVVADLLATKQEAAGQMLASALLSGHDTRGLLDDYESLMVQTSFEEEAATEVRCGHSVVELTEKGFDPEGLIQLWPLSLNTRLEGGLKPGHHVVLFGRPEIGKTMVVIDMIAGFLHQGLRVLYVGNEDPIDDINMRVVNRLSGMNKHEVLNAPKEADSRAREAGYELLIMAALSPGTKREISDLIETHRPEVLVLDQLRNINMHNDNFVLQLDEAAKMARTWAKKNSCVVVSVTQAGDSASGKAWLDMGDVDFSNTGIPATADLMIGIGAADKNIQRGEIVLSLPKNKVSGRHEYFAVLTDPTLSQLIPLD